MALPEFSGQNWCTLQARKNGFSGKIIVPARSQGGQVFSKHPEQITFMILISLQGWE